MVDILFRIACNRERVIESEPRQAFIVIVNKVFSSFRFGRHELISVKHSKKVKEETIYSYI